MKIIDLLTNRWWMVVELELGYRIVFTKRTLRSSTIKFVIYDFRGNIADSGTVHDFPTVTKGHHMGMFHAVEDEYTRFFDHKDPWAYLRVRRECSELEVVKVRSNFPI